MATCLSHQHPLVCGISSWAGCVRSVYRCTGRQSNFCSRLQLRRKESNTIFSKGTFSSARIGLRLAGLAAVCLSGAWRWQWCVLIRQRLCRILGQAIVRCTTRCYWTTRRRACFGGHGATTPRTYGHPQIATWRLLSRPPSTFCPTPPSSPLSLPPWPPCAAESLNTGTNS